MKASTLSAQDWNRLALYSFLLGVASWLFFFVALLLLVFFARAGRDVGSDWLGVVGPSLMVAHIGCFCGSLVMSLVVLWNCRKLKPMGWLLILMGLVLSVPAAVNGYAASLSIMS
ncbi:hypothetical protein [Botrimarina mediterranea]|uniref:hypothetical protein n=1 Tax=Botrimarina mediterranea TaxID=2528022 RepID=UPI00118A407A|nr:hypothetical protein K2D_13740 [Planctomycetes bacterium K2D]